VITFSNKCVTARDKSIMRQNRMFFLEKMPSHRINKSATHATLHADVELLYAFAVKVSCSCKK
jgi:hypothetical protein